MTREDVFQNLHQNMAGMIRILWYDTLDSTNSEASRRLSELPSMTAIAAERQTSGRGQRGNLWRSEAGSNLTFSIVIKPGEDGFPPIKAACQFVISEAVAIGICNFLKENGASAEIKWPNDIYCGNRKICGILIENTLRGSEVSSCIIGIGLNLNQDVFPPDIPNPVSLRLLTGRSYDLRESAERLSENIYTQLQRIENAPESLRNEYLSILYQKDKAARYRDMSDGREFTGIIRGISASALLRVETETKEIREYAFKEIGYIL